MFGGRTLPVPLVAVLFIIAGFLILAIGNRFFRGPVEASVSVLAEDSQTGRFLVELPVEVGGTLSKTGEDGRAVFTDLYVGLQTFKISLPNFKDFFQTVNLKQGKNEEIVFSLEIITAQVKGRILDSTTKRPIEEAAVVMGGALGKTDTKGRFTLDEVIIGTPTLEVRKDGYEELSVKASLVKGVTKDLGDLFLAQPTY